MKILAQAGISLADSYNVVGSTLHVSDLLASEGVHLMHEMGGTMFSERFSGEIRILKSGDILQSANFSATIPDFPDTPTRVHSIALITDTTSRLANVNVVAAQSLEGPSGDKGEIPLFVWDGTNEDLVRFNPDGLALINALVLRPQPEYTLLPTMLTGNQQPIPVDKMRMRGTASAFGAGTVEVTMLVHVSFAQAQGISSLGLPIPGW